MINCEVCGTETREGDYGQSKYICENINCERSNSNWAADKRNKILKPITDQMEVYSSFSHGTIDFYDARWRGEGSAEINLSNGTQFMCHFINGQFEPFDNPYFKEMNINLSVDVIQEIKGNVLKLIELRKELSEVVKKG